MRLFASGLLLVVMSLFCGNAAEAQFRIGIGFGVGINFYGGCGYSQHGSGFLPFGGGLHQDYPGFNAGPTYMGPNGVPYSIPQGVPVSGGWYYSPYSYGREIPYATYITNAYPGYTYLPLYQYYPGVQPPTYYSY